MRVIRRDKRDFQLARESHDSGVDALLLLKPVILQFEIIVFAEKLLHPERVFLGAVIVARLYRARDISGKAG